jgi:hypothetical protein
MPAMPLRATMAMTQPVVLTFHPLHSAMQLVGHAHATTLLDMFMPMKPTAVWVSVVLQADVHPP